MTLTNALRSATSALAGNAKHASILARNVAGVGDPNYVRRDAVVTTKLYGGIKIDVQRNVQRSLYNSAISSNADAANANTVKNGVDRLIYSMGIDDFGNSPASMLGDLKEAVELAAAAPSNPGASSALIEHGRTFATAINGLYSEVLASRADSDKEIASSVEKLNSLLAQLETINEQVVKGTQGQQSVLESIDIRDGILEKMSHEVGLKIVPRGDNDIMVLTSNGLVMFETNARTISFQPTASFGPNTTGNALYIDGVAASGDEPWLPVTTGRLGGAFRVRDEILVNQQNQLDEIARSVIELFSEEDQVNGLKPKLTGMFTWDGGPAVPPVGVLQVGIAGTIRINALVDPQSGGDPMLVRDGAINGDADYLYNSTGGSGYSDHLLNLASSFDDTTTFAPLLGLLPNQSVNDFAASSLDWLNSTRQAAHNISSYQSELSIQYSHAYQSDAGSNLDTEMSKLLEVERAYQASAKLLATIDEMYAVFFNAMRA